jgi:hypothetical protein
MNFLTESVPFGDMWEGGLDVRALLTSPSFVLISIIDSQRRQHGAATFVRPFSQW